MNRVVRLKEFNEEDHPRDDDGKFTDSGGGSGDSSASGGGGGDGGGGKTNIHIGGSGSSKDKIQSGWHSIPESHQKLLSKISILNVAEINGGHTQGLTTTYNRTDTTVKIADKVAGRNLKDPTGTTVHELGHAMDNLSGHAYSREVASVVREEAARLPKADARLAAHYLSNEREMFAEAYRLTYSTSGRGAFAMGQKTAEKRFPKSIAAVRALRT